MWELPIGENGATWKSMSSIQGQYRVGSLLLLMAKLTAVRDVVLTWFQILYVQNGDDIVYYAAIVHASKEQSKPSENVICTDE
jgi:hypothetical protein